VLLTVNTAAGDRRPISRFIYGMNAAEKGGTPAGFALWYGATLPAEVTLNRFGGNRLSAFNWVTGWSNVGADGDFSNDSWLLENYGTAVGSAVAGRVNASFARKQGIILTIPMLGYVAGNTAGIRLTTTDADRTARLAAHFKESKPFKGAPFTLTPNPADPVVYQDEFVNWVNTTWPNHGSDPQTPILFSLDNEPDAWTGTHKEIRSDSADNPRRPRLFTYDGFADTSILYARAVKSVMPDAQVLGPALATYAGIIAGGRYTDYGWYDDPKYGQQNFVDVYLDRMKQAEQTYGRRLMDALTVHYYPAAGTGGNVIGNDFAPQTAAMKWARLQAPRSLWDPTYNEGSWVSTTAGGPIEFIPRLRRQIAAHYLGTKLAITEYFFGRGGDIEGGLAQADVLGIFGREEVYAATFWPEGNVYAPPYQGDGARAYAFVIGAFKLFLNYDGKGSRFGDTSVIAKTDDNLNSSVYASLDANNQLVIVAINKRSESSTATIEVTDPRTLNTVSGAYRISSSSATPVAVEAGAIYRAGGNKFMYLMPPLSATVIALAP
jgi:hypothetical protein